MLPMSLSVLGTLAVTARSVPDSDSQLAPLSLTCSNTSMLDWEHSANSKELIPSKKKSQVLTNYHNILAKTNPKIKTTLYRLLYMKAIYFLLRKNRYSQPFLVTLRSAYKEVFQFWGTNNRRDSHPINSLLQLLQVMDF